MTNETYKNDYGYFIRRVLQERKITLNRFCEINRLPKTAIYAICEYKTKDITALKLREIALALGYSGLLDFFEAYKNFQIYSFILSPQYFARAKQTEENIALITFVLIFIVIALIGYYTL